MHYLHSRPLLAHLSALNRVIHYYTQPPHSCALLAHLKVCMKNLVHEKCDYVLAGDTLQASNRLAGGLVVCSDITKFLYSNFYILLFIY